MYQVATAADFITSTVCGREISIMGTASQILMPCCADDGFISGQSIPFVSNCFSQAALDMEEGGLPSSIDM